MNPRRRARLLQAHNLRCQGLTLRQIADQMGCAHSTVSQYLRDFHTHQDAIIETLAADHLVHSLSQLDPSDQTCTTDTSAPPGNSASCSTPSTASPTASSAVRDASTRARRWTT